MFSLAASSPNSPTTTRSKDNRKTNRDDLSPRADSSSLALKMAAINMEFPGMDLNSRSSPDLPIIKETSPAYLFRHTSVSNASDTSSLSTDSSDLSMSSNSCAANGGDHDSSVSVNNSQQLQDQPQHSKSVLEEIIMEAPTLGRNVLLFAALYQLTHPISMLLVPSYRRMSLEQQILWCTRPGSFLHACLASWASGRVLVRRQEVEVLRRPYTQESKAFQDVSLLSVGYFVADLFTLLHNRAALGGVRKQLPTLLHHAMASTGFYTMRYTRWFHFFGLARLFTETSTIFLNVREWLSSSNSSSSSSSSSIRSGAAKANDLLFLLSFFLSRICALPCFHAVLLRGWADAAKAPAWIKAYFLAVVYASDGLNLFWWWKIVCMLGSSSKPPRKQPVGQRQ